MTNKTVNWKEKGSNFNWRQLKGIIWNLHDHFGLINISFWKNFSMGFSLGVFWYRLRMVIFWKIPVESADFLWNVIGHISFIEHFSLSLSLTLVCLVQIPAILTWSSIGSLRDSTFLIIKSFQIVKIRLLIAYDHHLITCYPPLLHLFYKNK
jgi:hypothetical protein